MLRWVLIATLCIGGAGICSAGEPHNPLAAGELPQYVFFNRIPGSEWNQNRPDSVTPASMEAAIHTLGTGGTHHLRIGLSFIFSIMETPPERLRTALESLLSASERSGVPILVTIDGQNWWESRSDLWNWWDPTLPGFNPANRRNVEWTGWGPEHAVKVGWRNWGHQVRVRAAPNLASPRFLAEHWKAYDVLVPVLVRWHHQLPPDRKFLFGGLKIGWEASINVNAYYHPGGNAIYERSPADASGDPTAHDPSAGWTFGKPPLGYAAVSTAGIRKSGRLMREDVEEAVRRYLEQLSAYAVRKGLPAHLVFTHQGGTYAPWDQHMSFRAGMNAYSIPGWSFYSHDPSEIAPLREQMEAAGHTQWAASEWWRGGPDAETWRQRFEAALRFKQCRFVCVYNWEAFEKVPEAIAGIRQLVERASRPAP